MGGRFDLYYPTLTGKHQTLLGGYITILLALVVLSSSALIFSQYFDKEAPVVTSTTEFNSNFTDFNLYEEELFPILSILIGNRAMPVSYAARFFTPKIQIEETYYNNQTKKFDYRLLHSFHYVPCSQIKDPKILNVLQKLNSAAIDAPDMGFCPDFRGSPEEFRAARNLNNSTYRYAMVRMYPCSLPDPSECASPLELAQAGIGYSTNDRLLKSSNYEEPITLSPEFRSFSIDISATKNREFEARLNHIEDDTSVLWKPSLRKEYVTLHQMASDFKRRSADQLSCTKAQIEMGPMGGCQEYAYLVNGPSGKLVKTRRSYRKITMVLGELGGFIKLLTTISFFVYSYYNARSVKKYLKNNLYNFDSLLKQKKSAISREGLIKIDNKVCESEAGFITSRSSRSTVEGPKTKELLVDKKKYENVIKQCIADRRRGMDLMSKLDFVEMLQELIFENHDKVLLPLLILRLKEKQMNKKNHQKQNQSKKKKKINFDQEQIILSQKKGSLGAVAVGHDVVHEEEMDYEKAFKALKNSKPKTCFKKAIKGLMLENVKIFFETDTDELQDEELGPPRSIMPDKKLIKLKSNPEARSNDFEEIKTPPESPGESGEISSHEAVNRAQMKDFPQNKLTLKKAKNKKKKKMQRSPHIKFRKRWSLVFLTYL